jgi:taurine dioxygenase
MSPISISPLEGSAIGVQIVGLSLANVARGEVRSEVRAAFEWAGLIVFRGMEQSDELQIAVSGIIGPPQAHALKELNRDPHALGLIELTYQGNIVEENGKSIEGLVPWHFDACYSDKLNRAALLRALEIAPEGGLTGFADGVQLYKAISSDLRAAFEELGVIYHPTATHNNQLFGKTTGRKWVSLSEKMRSLYAANEAAPRAIHPAIWQRQSGEHVLHVSPWQAVGVWGRENSEGAALLEALCQQIYEKMEPYWHKWEPTDLVLWDNWRFIHCAGGNDPQHKRAMRRTTIKGDYGLGSYEADLMRASALDPRTSDGTDTLSIEEAE